MNNWVDKLKSAELTVRNFIEGEYVKPSGTNKITKHSPRDGALLYEFFDSELADVERAVASARSAFNDGRWRNLSVHHRKAILQEFARLIEEKKETFALYECLDVGKPITMALADDVMSTVSQIRGAGEKADKLLSDSALDLGMLSYKARKPVGVVGGIVGWNYPMTLAAGKIGPALAMGNSIVVKPSEYTSLSASLLAETAIEAGVPPGVFNVVNGFGGTVGDALARHPSIDLLSFTGGTETGKRIMKAAGASNMKRLILECGGKSPYIVFDDFPGDMDGIAGDIVSTAFANQGALCAAGTRLLVHEPIKDALMPKIVARASELIPNDPLDPDTRFGAIMSEEHMKKVLGFIKSGKNEGADLVAGGRQIKKETGGFYLEPAIFDNVNPKQKIAREEIFGPVLSVFTFRSEEEALNLANDSSYGLAAYVATQELGRAQRFGHGLDAGLVFIVGATSSSGGVELGIEPQKESGFGVAGGLAGLEAYCVKNTVMLMT